MTADARVETEKSSRYLQVLCGHFSRKVKAEYSSEHGRVDFGFGVCTLSAETDALLLHVEADNAKTCGRVKDVVGGHLERFAAKDELTVTWTDA